MLRKDIEEIASVFRQERLSLKVNGGSSDSWGRYHTILRKIARVLEKQNKEFDINKFYESIEDSEGKYK